MLTRGQPLSPSGLLAPALGQRGPGLSTCLRNERGGTAAGSPQLVREPGVVPPLLTPHPGWLVSTFLLSRCGLGEVLLAREWACWALVRWVSSQNLAQLRTQH